jgi:methylenetetrahydrofolate dehydrogenase (NADP+)/methenyltetrahydrofolate cyclohydrolase
MATILFGRNPARCLRANIQLRVKGLIDRGLMPCLRTVRVGDDDAAAGYVRGIGRAGQRVDVQVESDLLPPDTSTADLVNHIHRLNSDDTVHGVILAFPFPDLIEEAVAVDAIDPIKDVDRVTSTALGELLTGRVKIGPATASAVIEMLDFAGEPIRGRSVTIVGRSNVVGKPLWAMMVDGHATVTVCHTRTAELSSVTSKAEILVVAAGQPGLIGLEHVGENAVVLDVGTNYVNGNLVGDVKFEEVEPCARMITPVPGGIGPLTNYCLMRNLVDLIDWAL